METYENEIPLYDLLEMVLHKDECPQSNQDRHKDNGLKGKRKRKRASEEKNDVGSSGKSPLLRDGQNAFHIQREDQTSEQPTQNTENKNYSDSDGDDIHTGVRYFVPIANKVGNCSSQPDNVVFPPDLVSNNHEYWFCNEDINIASDLLNSAVDNNNTENFDSNTIESNNNNSTTYDTLNNNATGEMPQKAQYIDYSDYEGLSLSLFQYCNKKDRGNFNPGTSKKVENGAKDNNNTIDNNINTRQVNNLDGMINNSTHHNINCEAPVGNVWPEPYRGESKPIHHLQMAFNNDRKIASCFDHLEDILTPFTLTNLDDEGCILEDSAYFIQNIEEVLEDRRKEVENLRKKNVELLKQINTLSQHKYVKQEENLTRRFKESARADGRKLEGSGGDHDYCIRQTSLPKPEYMFPREDTVLNKTSPSSSKTAAPLSNDRHFYSSEETMDGTPMD